MSFEAYLQLYALLNSSTPTAYEGSVKCPGEFSTSLCERFLSFNQAAADAFRQKLIYSDDRIFLMSYRVNLTRIVMIDRE